MRRCNPFLNILIGLAICLVTGAAWADDVVALTVWGSTNHPDNPSSISINNGSFVKTFTDDATFNNVTVTDDGTGAGTITIAQGDIQFAPSSDMFFGFTFNEQLRAQSDLNGTYDRNSGSATAAVNIDLKITSNAPGFNNNTCVLPQITINATTDNGVAYSGGAGTLVDNTFAVGSFAHGSCGSFFLIGDYADRINAQLHLPSPSGNVVTLANSMNPALPP
jgi:hypothetical protein